MGIVSFPLVPFASVQCICMIVVLLHLLPATRVNLEVAEGHS